MNLKHFLLFSLSYALIFQPTLHLSKRSKKQKKKERKTSTTNEYTESSTSLVPPYSPNPTIPPLTHTSTLTKNNSVQSDLLVGIIVSVLVLCVLGMTLGYKTYSAHQKKNQANAKFKALKSSHVDSLNPNTPSF